MTAITPARTLAARRVPEALDLSDNTSLYGVPPAALRVLRATAADGITRYPSPFADDLRDALSRYAGAAVAQVTTGCGSDDVLDSIFRAFAAPGERLAFSDPTFSMVPVLARRNRLEPVPVALTRDFDLDAPRLLASGAPVIYLCSPNNPTGASAARASVVRIIDGTPGLVVLDEAYAEFADDTFLAEATRRRNLLVVRTFSKAFGLAGLRVGWAVGDPALISRVEEARGPYKVGAAAEAAATAALMEDQDWVRARIAEVRRDRTRLLGALTAMGLSPLPSAANFVLVPVRDAVSCAERMARAGVAVRPFAALAGIGDAIRITVAPPPAFDRALAALREALS